MRPSGVTLVELIVVLAILGLVFGVTGLALTSLKAPRMSDSVRALAQARVEAIRTGRPVTAGAHHTPLIEPVLFLPDGRAIGPGADPITGAPRDTAR